MGRNLHAWVDFDREWPAEGGRPRAVHTLTFARLSFDRDGLLFDLLAGAGRGCLEETLAEARALDLAGVAEHLRRAPPLVALAPKGLPERLGDGPEDDLKEAGFVRPAGSVFSRLYGQPRPPEDCYRCDERPTYTWPPEDPAYSGYSWLTGEEVAAVADRYAVVPVVEGGRVGSPGRLPELDAVAAMLEALDRHVHVLASRFVFWFGD